MVVALVPAVQERLMQLWQSEPKNRVKEEMKGGNMKKERKSIIDVHILIMGLSKTVILA